MLVSDLREGQCATILRINGEAEQSQRLKELGFVKGNTVRVTMRVLGTVVVSCMHSTIAIGQSVAQTIEVSELCA